MAKHLEVSVLVDHSGDIMEWDSDEEADMCEMVRAIVHSGKIPKSGDLTNINPDFIQKLNCPGSNKQT